MVAYGSWHVGALALAAALIAAGPHEQGAQAGALVSQQPSRSPVIATVRVGQDPIALVVDERSRRVFVLDRPGAVSVLDAMTGRLLCTVPLGHDLQAVALDAATGRVFVTDQTRVFTLDARSGAVLRALALGGGPARGLTLDARHAEAFVAVRGANHGIAGSGPRHIAVLDARTGRLRRSSTAQADLLAVDGNAGRLIVPLQCGGDALTADACLDTRDEATGRLVKTTDLGGEEGMAQQLTAVAVDAHAGSAIVLYGDGRGTSNIAVLATRTGTRRAPTFGAGGTLGTIAIDAGRGRAVVATTPDSYVGGGGSGPRPATTVLIFDTRSGQPVAGRAIPGASGGVVYPPGVAADRQKGRFYVVATPGAPTSLRPGSILDVFDAASGRLVRTVALPAAAPALNAVMGPALALDDRTGRLFIANAEDGTVSVLDTARL